MGKLHRVAFFDWHNTLSDTPFWHHWRTQYPEYYRRIQGAFFGNDTETTVRWMRGEFTAEDICALLNERTRIPRKKLEAGLRESSRILALMDEGVLARIADLRSRGISTVIATDNMDTFQRWTVPALGLNVYFDDILDSHRIGALKGDVTEDGYSRFFHDYLQNRGIDPRHAVLFDDNVSAAEQLGLDYREVTRGNPLGSQLAAYIRQNEPDDVI